MKLPRVLNQDETPLLYSLVFGEGVVNDATSVVLFNAVQNFDLSNINTGVALRLIGNFGYLFLSSTVLGVLVNWIAKCICHKEAIFWKKTFIFLYVGMDALDIEKWRVVSDSPNTIVSASATLLGLVLAGRAAFVFSLSFLINLTKKTDKKVHGVYKILEPKASC
ncbi:hypothetical protein CASFOL_029472 [Castilleja foliolosa]|uniref:Cation/H+ exchanger transmembrane domain-containing protein n=1 Tax=Castilleja foliolosa TaxID=1961234 RepID=A0ABD3CAV9_9LAMI